MESTIESLCNQMARSQLLEGAVIRNLRGQWRGEAGTAADNVAAFRQWLVRGGKLSEFQLDMMERGYGEFLKFGEYRLQERIGSGRMAGIYKAVHPLGQIVAIKVLPPSRSTDAQILGRFLREARMAIRLEHDNVVRTFQNGLQKGMHYIVMEYLAGETLEETLQRRQRLPFQEAVPVLIQALQGLDHLQEIGLVHRDLKPGNLMLVSAECPGASTLSCTVKILDIGLGRALFDEGAPGAGEVANLTTLGAIVGTLDYMAPEQARSAHMADIRADIYSLGCVMYEMLAGQPPFRDANFARQLRRHEEEKPRPLSEHVPDLPAAIDAIVQRMLAKDPAMRYAVPSQVLKDLKVLALSAPAPRPVRPLRSYLTWLESQPKDALPTASALAEAPPAEPAETPPNPMPQALPMATPVFGPITPLVALSVAREAADGALLSVAKTQAVTPVITDGIWDTNPALVLAKGAWTRIRAFGWGKRDWIAAAVGAGAILVVQGVYWLARSLFD